MTVIIAQDAPDAIRGILKRWFIEPKPNVFVGTITSSTRNHVLTYIRSQAAATKMLIIYSSPNCQGYEIEHINEPEYSKTSISGLWLVATQSANKELFPF